MATLIIFTESHWFTVFFPVSPILPFSYILNEAINHGRTFASACRGFDLSPEFFPQIAVKFFDVLGT